MRPITGQANKEYKSGICRGMLCGIALRDYPKQVVSLTKAKSVPANIREFLSGAQRHYRIDVTASTVEPQKQVSRHLLVRPGGPHARKDTQHSHVRFVVILYLLTGAFGLQGLKVVGPVRSGVPSPHVSEPGNWAASDRSLVDRRSGTENSMVVTISQ